MNINVSTDARHVRKSAAAIQQGPTYSTCKGKKEISSSMLKKSTVDFIIKDASDPDDKMPLDAMDVDRMKLNGMYFASQKFVSEESFVSFLKTNKIFGTHFSKDLYLYTIRRQYASTLKPSGYHRRNFPAENSMESICQSKFLIISPFPKNNDEKKEFFNTVKVGDHITIDIEECDSDESSESHKEISIKKELFGAEEDDEEMPYSGEHHRLLNDIT